MDPPTAPIPNAPPTSSRIRSGHGSREVSGVPISSPLFLRRFGGGGGRERNPSCGLLPWRGRRGREKGNGERWRRRRVGSLSWSMGPLSVARWPASSRTRPSSERWRYFRRRRHNATRTCEILFHWLAGPGPWKRVIWAGEMVIMHPLLKKKLGL